MKKRGFTLVELLTVIAILAIILLIAAPVIMNVLEKAKRGAFLDSVISYAYAIKSEYSIENIENINATTDFVIIDGKVNGKYIVSNEKELFSGIVNFNSNGRYFLIITDGKYCAYKNYNDKEPQIVDNEYCDIDLNGGIYNPIIEVENENIISPIKQVTINYINDINSNKYCILEDINSKAEDCDNWTVIDNSMITFTVNKNVVIYAKVSNDEKELITSKIVSNIGEAEIDKTPIIDSLTLSAGTNYITATVSATPYIANKIVKYYYSIDNKNYIESQNQYYTFDNLEENIEYEIKVYVEDNQGNISKVKTASSKTLYEDKIPTISLTTTSGENDITVTVTPTAYNGATISKYYYSIDDGEYIESSNQYYKFNNLAPTVYHKIKVYVIDSNNLESLKREISAKTNYVDTTPVINGLTLSSSQNDIFVTVSAQAHNGNRIEAFYYRINNGEYIEKTEPIHKFSDLEPFVDHIIDVYVKDSNGKLSKVSQVIGKTLYEDKVPTITALTTSSGEDSIVVVVSAQSYGGSKITNYYYSIDDTTYISSAEPRYTFSGVAPFEEHVIKAYVKDNNGRVSDVSSLTAITSKQHQSPTIDNLTTTSGENDITVTVDANAYDNTTILKYYYSIDGGEYIESTQNYYNFSDLSSNRDHTFRVYVIDSINRKSSTSSISAVTNAAVPYLTIIANNQGIEYNGEMWYPYGTSITLSYSPDMTNLTGYYQSVNESSKVESGWTSSGTSRKKNITLRESYTYRIKIINSNGTESPVVEKKINIMPRVDTNSGIPANYHKYNMGGIYPVYIPTSTYIYTSSIYGTDYYRNSGTNISTSAVHMGLIKYDGQYTTESKLLYIKLIPCPEEGYKGSTRNGITSSASRYSSSNNGYVFVKEDGTEIKGPRINGLTAATTENDITVAVTTESYNGTRIEKYYYSIDNGEYIESQNPYINFDNLQPDSIHTINVYVVDTNGMVSSVESVTTEAILISPVITLSKDGIEYNGEMWYPYGTTITIKYSENMKNRYYQKEAIGGESAGDWLSSANVTQTNSLQESYIYRAKQINQNGEESKTVEKKINIMPNVGYTPVGIPNDYYTYNMGGIYPVYIETGTSVSKTSSYALWGTDYYRNANGYIARAAAHMGLIQYSGSKTTESKLLYIKLMPCPDGGYIGSERNGITTDKTNCSGSNTNGYIFVTKEGTQIFGSQ